MWRWWIWQLYLPRHAPGKDSGEVSRSPFALWCILSSPDNLYLPIYLIKLSHPILKKTYTMEGYERSMFAKVNTEVGILMMLWWWILLHDGRNHPPSPPSGLGPSNDLVHHAFSIPIRLRRARGDAASARGSRISPKGLGKYQEKPAVSRQRGEALDGPRRL